MRDINFSLRKKYKSLLSGVTYNSVAVPAFYQEAPGNNTAANYIVFGQINNTNAGTKYKSQVFTNISITIHTFNEKNNNGQAADNIAGQILEIINPDPQTHIDLSEYSLQCVSTQLSNDVTQDYSIQADRKYIDRVLTFRHLIFQQ